VSHLTQWRLRGYKYALSVDSIETELRWSPNMSRRKSPRPVIGCAFDPEQNNTQENFRAIAGELRHYRPRGFSNLARELERYAAKIESDDTSRDWAQFGFEAEDEAFRLLSAMAEQRAPGGKRCRGGYPTPERGGGAGFCA
jgi:hypothetical protein